MNFKTKFKKNVFDEMIVHTHYSINSFNQILEFKINTGTKFQSSHNKTNII